MKHYIDGHWYLDITRLSMCYVRPGEYEEGVEPEVAYEVASHLLPGLFQAALNAGVLPMSPELNSRMEDLKIIHRLLDLLNKGGSTTVS